MGKRKAISGRGQQRTEHPNGHPKIGRPKLRVIGSAGPRQGDYPAAERDYFAQLHRLIDDIFVEAADTYQWTWCQLSAHANLTYGTVSNLGERITKYPRFQTVYKLAHAVGWDLITERRKGRRGASPAKVKIAAG